ncbi:alcohol oxidase [Mycena belliarum]|uniref:Alcohol oxidase n=1 Tax=Mycena belliarum TaxID=1033014 RepID=A0AAD6XS90_9AGAR|nr:alcohol oxidase [Mycena belliae]
MWPFNARTKYPAISVEQAGTLLQTTEHCKSLSAVTYDYIVVGGGTAGCCLAARLSEDPSVSVLVLERGGVHDIWSSRIPLISSNPTDKSNPIFRSPSAPLEAAEGQIVDIIHAQTLGGGSSVNGLLVTRGAVGDFDNWAALGHPSWDYASLNPYFIKSEKSLSHHSNDRGYSGPWVNQTVTDLPFKVQRKVKDAAIAFGLADVTNLNSPTIPVDVCAMVDAAIDEDRRRVSTYHAFLPAETVQKRRDHLKICINAVATRIRLDAGVAVGVEFGSSQLTEEPVAHTYYAQARKEIVICCGALGSPQLLLLSGIGRKEDLDEHGIETAVDLPGVGAHLQDHAGLPIMYEVPLEDTMLHIANSAWKGLLEFGKYMFARKGMLGSIVSPLTIFAHSSHLDEKTAKVISPIPAAAPGSNRPDLEIMPIAYWCAEAPPYKIKIGVFSFLLCVVQPKSLGSVRLASRDPHARPIVDLGFLSNPEDFVLFRKGVTLALRLAEEVHRQGYPMKKLQVPTSESKSDVDDYIRANIRTCYHYASTCRMARREDGGVVNDELEVYGVRGLRVCDTSVFPCITSSHTMAPAVVVAEKCADMMKKRM